MKRSLFLLGVLAAHLLLPGCGSGESAPASNDKTGAPACDAYVARLEACAGAAPADLRTAHDAAIREARDRFEHSADTAASDTERVALEDTCKRLTDALSGRPGCP
ncbi:hypothetical protein [Chondromyces apiculatus]|uniref:Lipoprotein n=1 Tax=Chondromyces apiculatus DSM 436 TaxID=1192034 RepID=A0A017T6K1_9BACT|nr:hypothetical protein [Chondromyces apiculatus]EYF04420.1 Hypothetical protein CAP_4559 [Chondromyces apiculatus DSM 436]